MTLRIICFTATGGRLALDIERHLQGWEVELYGKGSWELPRGIQPVATSLGDWAGCQFQENRALLFIGAAGIAVRAIAPFVRDKLKDVPVVVMDEKGRFVIPLLSGHVGGANELAFALAECTGAEPVITTATDVEGRFAVDVFAARNGLLIDNREGIAYVSARILRGERLTLWIQDREEEDYRQEEMPEGIVLVSSCDKGADIVISSCPRDLERGRLGLRPRPLILGMGCRRGKTYEELEQFASGVLEAEGRTWREVHSLASIDIKAEEEGLRELARRKRIPFFTYSAEELKKAVGSLHASSFVEDRVGVDNVCERSALLAAGPRARLVVPKQSRDGMTLALAEGGRRLSFQEGMGMRTENIRGQE